MRGTRGRPERDARERCRRLGTALHARDADDEHAGDAERDEADAGRRRPVSRTGASDDGRPLGGHRVGQPRRSKNREPAIRIGRQIGDERRNAMTLMRHAAAITAMVLGLTAAACSKSGQPTPAPASPATPSASTSVAQATDITFKSDPDPVKTGENTFEAMVMQNGKPVDDATVSAEFYMPAMPAMKMPEMRMKTDLMPAGNGTYRGKGQVMMAGNWDVTVMAMRGGQELGTKKL